MRYFAPIVLIVLVFAIMVGGSYDNAGVGQTSLKLVPTATAQPELILSAIGAYNGVRSVNMSASDNRLLVTYYKGHISIDDLRHILSSLGYRSAPTGDGKVRAGM